MNKKYFVVLPSPWLQRMLQVVSGCTFNECGLKRNEKFGENHAFRVVIGAVAFSEFF
jgi:hypothetical protein